MNSLEMWLLKVSDSPKTLRAYTQCIRKFRDFAETVFGLDIANLKDAWREVKYSNNEGEKEKFLDQLNDVVESFRAKLKNENLSPKNLALHLTAIRSYLKKGCGIPIEIELPKRPQPRFHNRDITKEEIKKILEHANIRDRCFFLMMVESGLRPSTLAQLQYYMIKEDYEAHRIPMMIKLPSEILKDRIGERFTFIGEDAYKLLREYLSSRGNIGDYDYIFLAKRSDAKEKHPTEETFSTIFNRLVLKLGLDTPRGNKPKQLRLYCLRKYFFNNMKCDSDYKNFWFCHVGVNDSYISRDVEKHRQEYMKGYPYLRIYEPSENSKTKELEDKLSQAYMTIGQLQLELERQRRESLSVSELMELFKDTLPPEIYQKLQAKLNTLKQQT